jgi:hypothetical protein
MLFMNRLIISLIITQLLTQTYSYAQATNHSNKPKDRIKAKIGIRLEDKNGLRKAKAIDKISVGDKLSIYVKPWKDSYVYIINLNKTNATLLNSNNDAQIIKKDVGKIFMGEGSGYSPDGLSSKDALIVIVSPSKNNRIMKLFSSGPVPSNKWHKNEEEIMLDNSLIPHSMLQEQMEFGGSLANQTPGNKWKIDENIVPQERLIAPLTKTQEHIEIGSFPKEKDSFWSKLRISAGKSMIVRKYEFNVTK